MNFVFVQSFRSVKGLCKFFTAAVPGKSAESGISTYAARIPVGPQQEQLYRITVTKEHGLTHGCLRDINHPSVSKVSLKDVHISDGPSL